MFDRKPYTPEEMQRYAMPANSRQLVCRSTPRQPRKNDFPLLGRDKKSIDVGGEACIAFNDDSRTVVWRVSENNHACDYAHEHPMGKAFFQAMSQVNWTRGTGGTIIGNDEYNQDGSCPPSGPYPPLE